MVFLNLNLCLCVGRYRLLRPTWDARYGHIPQLCQIHIFSFSSLNEFFHWYLRFNIWCQGVLDLITHHICFMGLFDKNLDCLFCSCLSIYNLSVFDATDCCVLHWTLEFAASNTFSSEFGIFGSSITLVLGLFALHVYSVLRYIVFTLGIFQRHSTYFQRHIACFHLAWHNHPRAYIKGHSCLLLATNE